MEAARILGEAYYFAHRYDRAIAQLGEVLQMEPDYWFAHMSLGRAYLAAGNAPKAVVELQRANRLEPHNADALSALGNAYAVVGRKAEAKEVLKEQEVRSRAGDYVSPYFFAVVYAGMGNHDKAFEWLEKAYQERSIFMTWLKTDPVLDGLRSDPRFSNLVRRVNQD
jgi:tetratricopeptide (TPR) repeat protein